MNERVDFSLGVDVVQVLVIVLGDGLGKDDDGCTFALLGACSGGFLGDVDACGCCSIEGLFLLLCLLLLFTFFTFLLGLLLGGFDELWVVETVPLEMEFVVGLGSALDGALGTHGVGLACEGAGAGDVLVVDHAAVDVEIDWALEAPFADLGVQFLLLGVGLRVVFVVLCLAFLSFLEFWACENASSVGEPGEVPSTAFVAPIRTHVAACGLDGVVLEIQNHTLMLQECCSEDRLITISAFDEPKLGFERRCAEHLHVSRRQPLCGRRGEIGGLVRRRVWDGGVPVERGGR